jgi:hypothetical protein
MPNKDFIGFGTLEDWLEAIDSSCPVQADCVVEQDGTNKPLGLAYYKQVIVVSQPARDSVLYARVVVDRYDSMNGHTPIFDEEKHLRRSKSAWEVTRTWLIEHGLTVQRAVVAMPRSLKLLEGHAEFMRYDKESDTYLRAKQTDAAQDIFGDRPR